MKDNLGKMNKNEMAKQLMLLREQTKTTGMIHEAQILQLKFWPRVLFPSSVKAETRIDTDTQVVDIYVTTKGKGVKGQNKRTQLLGTSVQWLLGASWTCRIFVNNRDTLVLAGTGAVGNKYEGTDFSAGTVVPTKPYNFKGI